MYSSMRNKTFLCGINVIVQHLTKLKVVDKMVNSNCVKCTEHNLEFMLYIVVYAHMGVGVGRVKLNFYKHYV